MSKRKVARNLEITRRFWAGESPTALANEYNISRQRVYQIAGDYENSNRPITGEQGPVPEPSK